MEPVSLGSEQKMVSGDMTMVSSISSQNKVSGDMDMVSSISSQKIVSGDTDMVSSSSSSVGSILAGNTNTSNKPNFHLALQATEAAAHLFKLLPAS